MRDQRSETHEATLSAAAISAIDVTALLLTMVMLIAVASGSHGAVRILLALGFTSFVPGWALSRRLWPQLDSSRIPLAVVTSLAVAALGATAMVWLQTWHPLVWLVGLALGSVGLVTWTLADALLRALTVGMTAVEPIWVGQVDLSELCDIPMNEEGTLGYRSARLLVRVHRQPVGFVSVPIEGATITARTLRRAIVQQLSEALQAHLQAREETRLRGDAQRTFSYPSQVHLPERLISVIICTRDRSDRLAACLEAVQRLRYPWFEVIVVDNAPGSTATADLLRARFSQDSRVRYVLEPMTGLSRARNRGVAEARGEIVAFTDDDVLVDPWWLDAIAAGFQRDSRVACVTGLVPSARLDSAAEVYFDKRVTWGSSCQPCLFDLDSHRGNHSLYPYAAGLFGTGANFAFERRFLLTTGGFDEALGAGSRTRGGEDLDAFVRVIKAGRAIAYEPAAIGWHMHRAEMKDLRRQMFAYGLGLAAFGTKYLASRKTALDVLCRVPQGVRRAAQVVRRGEPAPAVQPSLALAELLGMAAGPAAYLLARLDSRRLAPARR
ncbi:MAG TPA: glycosyltransferase [Candidatus Sulfotelmatobacter sp.]|nr:glycosyltransferase [Candidatus Sulfotelmatobacter sp.]